MRVPPEEFESLQIFIGALKAVDAWLEQRPGKGARPWRVQFCLRCRG